MEDDDLVVFLLNYGRKGVVCVAERRASQIDPVCAAIADELLLLFRAGDVLQGAVF